METREQIIQAVRQHAIGHIEKHKMNVEIYLKQSVGIGEHGDIIETIEKEMKIVAEYEDLKACMEKYFGQDKGILSE